MLFAKSDVELSQNMVWRDGWTICQTFPHSLPESGWQYWRRWGDPPAHLPFRIELPSSVFPTAEHVHISQTQRNRTWFSPLRSSQAREGGPRPFIWKCISVRKKKCVFSEYFLWRDSYPSLTWQRFSPFLLSCLALPPIQLLAWFTKATTTKKPILIIHHPVHPKENCGDVINSLVNQSFTLEKESSSRL